MSDTPALLRRLRRVAALALLALCAHAFAADTTPPGAPGATTSPSCLTYVGDACYVNDADFTLNVTAAADEAGGSGINPSGYQVCRSNDITGWGGCDVSLSTTAGTSFVVTGAHRPAPGKRRAYYFRARDNAGNWGAWNSPIYVYTTTGADITPPGAPGDTTSAQCTSIAGGVCYVNPGNVTLTVTAAVDNAGGSGTNPNGYNFCRSVDTTGWAGCDVTLTTTGTTTFTVTGADLPAPGARRAYYARARDNAGNWGAWNAPLYVQTLADTTPPSDVPNALARINGANVNGLTVTVPNPSIAYTWSPATDNVGVTRYQMVVQLASSGAWTYNVTTPAPATSYTLATANLQGGAQYHTWIRALDAAGNGPNFTYTGTFTVNLADTTPPSAVTALGAKIGGAPLNNQVVAATNPSIAVNWGLATDNVAVANYQVQLTHVQSGALLYNVSVAHPATSYTLATSGLADGGNYSLAVRAVDTAGNAGPATSAGTFLVRLDTTPPSAPGAFTGRLNTRDIAGQQVPWNNPSVALTWNAATDAGGIKRYNLVLERLDVPGIVSSVMLSNTTFAYTHVAANLVTGGTYRYSIKAQDRSDNWGAVAVTGSYTIAPPLTASVQPLKELVINALPVVEDPVRTTGCGAWTFCAAMTALAGTQDPADFTQHFFELFNATQSTGDDSVAPATHVPQLLFAAWPRQANGKLDLTRAPLRLLAVVNRADLVRPGDAGEARLVFGFLTDSGDQFTLIIEYRMDLATLSRAQWWTEWHRLDAFDPASAEYRAQLQFLTDAFARTPVDGRIPLDQLRTNDGLIFRSTFFWQFREFVQPAAGAHLVETTVKQVPKASTSEGVLGDWINAHEAEILSESHVLGAPITLAAADFLGGVPTPSNVRNKTAGMLFSKNTCSGCHIANSQPPNDFAIFYQIAPRAAGREAKLSAFFFNQPLCGDSDEVSSCLFPYTQNELGRRKGIFEQDLADVGFPTAAKAAATLEFVPHEPTDAEVVTLDSMTRVH